MMGHKICFNEEIWIIIPKLSLLPFLSGALLLFLYFSSLVVEVQFFNF